ncbi:10 kDa heat shock protein, mitochondrial, partial [Ophiophagus hannah]
MRNPCHFHVWVARREQGERAPGQRQEPRKESVGSSRHGQAFKKFLPLFDRVLVERCAAETVTKGGIMIPEKSQGKVLQATVVADGNTQPISVKVGEKVLLPEYGGTKVILDDKDYFIFRDGDILGKYLD